ncbi:hypothetical protein A4A49_23248 [Nicotiana attenuata]|uniref:Uncharacterized protein n=1 Tax=Nicotiana attenuata TaxID=49451 RepID=A0A1J6IML4_NICAT|nr:hypothetical protein A4A49_23248 [Nicotiana attenuata]
MPICLSFVENEMMDKSSGGLGSLIRRKRVDAATQARQKLATQQLARKLSLFDLTAIGNSTYTLILLPLAIAHTYLG